METAILNNRIDKEVQKWEAREARFREIFPMADHANFLSEKMRYYETVLRKFNGDKNEDERSSYRVLNKVYQELERSLYPKLWQRLLRAITIPFRRQLVKQQAVHDGKVHHEKLKAQLVKAGFETLIPKMAYLLKGVKGKESSFSIPIAHFSDDTQKTLYSITYGKNEQGFFDFQGYQTEKRSADVPDATVIENLHYENNKMVSRTDAERLFRPPTDETSGHALNNTDKGLLFFFREGKKNPDGSMAEMNATSYNHSEMYVRFIQNAAFKKKQEQTQVNQQQRQRQMSSKQLPKVMFIPRVTRRKGRRI